MANLTRRFKLEYTDSNGNTQIIAEHGQDTGALKIDRHVHIPRLNDPDILKVWLEGTNFGQSIPTTKSEFGTAQNGTNEPEILYKQYNPDTSSFDTRGRFYAKNTGTIDEDGKLALKLYSFMKYTAPQDVSTGTITSDIEAVLNALLPSGYVADVPSGVTPPSVDSYSLNNRREKGYQELTRNYDYSLRFTSNLDSNNNYKVKFEPRGFGGTVDTLVGNNQAGRMPIIAVDTTNEIFTVNGDQTNDLSVDQAILVDGSTGNDGTYTISNLAYDSTNDETDITVNEDITDSTADGSIIPGGQAVFKAWQKDKTESIVNKVTVEGVDSNNNKVTGTAENTTMQGEVGVKFKKVKVGYVQSTSEAQNIAEGYLLPGKDSNGNDISELPEAGRVRTTVYTDNVVNDSFQVVSNSLNIDDTYTCVQQRNMWPEGITKLEFEFEQEGLEEQAKERENLRDERARLYPNQQVDAGNQGVTTGDALSNTAKTGGVGDSNDRGDDLSNVAKVGGVGDSNDRGNNLSNVAKVGSVNKHTNAELDGTARSDSNTKTLNSSGWTFVVAQGNNSNDALLHDIIVTITDIGSNSDLNIAITADDEFIVAHWNVKNVGNQNSDSLTGTLGDDNFYKNGNIITPINYTGSTVSYNVYMSTQGSGSPSVSATVGVNEINHFHPDNIDTDNNSMGLTDDVDTDNNSMGLTDDIATDDNLHGGGTNNDQHGGSTDTKNIDVAVEDKTDR